MMYAIDMKTLAERLRSCMSEAGINQAQFARESGISAPSINQWLKGTAVNMSSENLLKAAAYFNVNEKWLSDGIGKRRNDNAAPQAALLDLEIDANLLAEIISEVDRALFYKGEDLSLMQRASLIAMLYSEHQEITPELVLNAIDSSPSH